MSDTLTIFDDFDILYNNIMSNSAPGLDNIEKAFFLNKAQDELIKNYFNPKGNKYQEGVDDGPKRQINFSKLIEVGLSPNTPKYLLVNASSTTIVPNDGE